TQGSTDPPPRITSNVKQNLQFLKIWKEIQRRSSSAPRPATSYRRKKVEKEDLPPDTQEIYRDPTFTLYHTNHIPDTVVPVLLVDGYNVCGYWMKLKKHFMNGRLDVARQKLVDELIAFSVHKEVKVVVVFDAMMSGLPTHKETFAWYFKREPLTFLFHFHTLGHLWQCVDKYLLISFIYCHLLSMFRPHVLVDLGMKLDFVLSIMKLRLIHFIRSL
ncbi:unnamed protein product, partial [Linum tenue]